MVAKWTINKTTEKLIDGAYTRLLRSALNISWTDHVNNEVLYGSLPKVTSKIRERRMRLAGHCCRHNEEEASKVLLWQTEDNQTEEEEETLTLTLCLMTQAVQQHMNKNNNVGQRMLEVKNPGSRDIGRPWYHLPGGWPGFKGLIVLKITCYFFNKNCYTVRSSPRKIFENR